MRPTPRWMSGLSLLSLGVALSAPAAAQDSSSDDDIVVTGERLPVLSEESPTGSRLGLTILETPATVNVLSGDDIRARGDISMVAAVSRAPGITNAGNPGNGGLTFSVRGFSGQGSVLQLYDGIRLYPNNGSITFPSDSYNVERIDILSGPASVLYGQGALGGVVNVIPKSPNRDRLEAEAEAGYGSFDSWHVAAGAGGPLNDQFAFRADVSYRESDGYVDRGESDNLAISAALEFAPSDSFSLTLRNDYGNANPMKYFGTPLIDGKLDTSIRRENYNIGDATMHYRDNRTALTLDWQISDTISLANTAYYITSKRKWRNLESYADAGNGMIARADNYGIIHDVDQYGSQGNVTLSSDLGGGMSNDVLVGYDLNYFKLNYSHQFASVPQADEVARTGFDPGLFLDTVGLIPRYHTDTSTWAIYAEDRLALTDQVSLVGAIRHEENKVGRWNWVYTNGEITGDAPALNGGNDAHKTFTATTWRVGAVYQPVENVSLYAQYATAVDPLGTLTSYSGSETQFELSFADGYQYEAGVKGLFMGGKGSFTLAAYRLVKKNLFTQQVTNGPIEQVGQRSSQGIEATIDLALPAGFGFSANGTVLDANFDEFGGNEGNTPAGIPEESANAELRWSDGAGISARANLRYVGSRWGDNTNTVKIPSYTVVDLATSYAFNDNLALDLRLMNVFGEDYAWSTYGASQWILGRPRSVDVTLRAGF